MRERYVNILAALRERSVGASTALRGRFNSGRERKRTVAYRRLPKYGVLPNINTRAYFLFKLSV